VGIKGHDLVEVNGSEGSLLYRVNKPLVLDVASRPTTFDLSKIQNTYETVEVPPEMLTVPGTKRDPHEGEPGQCARYDQVYEFIDAIVNERDCSPSLYDGMRSQAIMDAVLQSGEQRRWIEVPDVGEAR